MESTGYIGRHKKEEASPNERSIIELIQHQQIKNHLDILIPDDTGKKQA